MTGAPVDIITAGWPCQDLSVAGRRAGLAGERSGLFWEVCRVADAIRPEWLLLENVPGLLSSNGGQDFWQVLGALADRGYDIEWRVLDAQYFGVPQRRRRVYIVGHHRDWPRPGTVLLEPEGSGGHPAEVRRTGEDVAYFLEGGAGGCSGKERTLIARPLTGRPYADGIGEEGKLVAHNVAGCAKHGRNPDVTDYVVSTRGHEGGSTRPLYYSHDYNQDRIYSTNGVAPACVQQDSNRARNILTMQGVRRLTPLECERLQGFPDGWTDCDLSDTTRYSLIGNAVAVPVIERIGRRLPPGRTFGELFAGIGGFRLGLERAGHTCLWANEIRASACRVRRAHWPDERLIEGDVREFCCTAQAEAAGRRTPGGRHSLAPRQVEAC
jgi:DNA (cytosine-5)-methyltransferase 1